MRASVRSAQKGRARDTQVLRARVDRATQADDATLPPAHAPPLASGTPLPPFPLFATHSKMHISNSKRQAIWGVMKNEKLILKHYFAFLNNSYYFN